MVRTPLVHWQKHSLGMGGGRYMSHFDGTLPAMAPSGNDNKSVKKTYTSAQLHVTCLYAVVKTKPFLRTSGGENLENYENLKRPWGATEKEILQHARRCEMRVFFFSLFAKFVPKDVKNGHLGKLLGSKKFSGRGLWVCAYRPPIRRA